MRLISKSNNLNRRIAADLGMIKSIFQITLFQKLKRVLNRLVIHSLTRSVALNSSDEFCLTANKSPGPKYSFQMKEISFRN